MSNAKFAAVASALAALTLEDLEKFGDTEVSYIRSLYRQSKENGVKLTFGLTDAELDELKIGKKIVAIKKVRERTNCGLAEAKDLVEAAINKGVPYPYNASGY